MKTQIHQLKWGIFNLIQGDLISYYASMYGEWSDLEVCFLRQLLDVQDNVVEVGANLGLHAVPMAKKITHGKLFCFEPQRVIFQHLCCNIALNQLTNVYCYPQGVSQHQEQIEVETTDYCTAWNYGAFSLSRGFSDEITFTGTVQKEYIDVINLDAHAEIQRLTSLKLLKIDAEGCELNVLAGARRTLERFKPMIFLEAHLHACDALHAYLQQCGYVCYWFISQRYQRDNYFKQTKNIDQGKGIDINFVCYPNEYVQQQPDSIPRYLKPVQALSHYRKGDQLDLPLVVHLAD